MIILISLLFSNHAYFAGNWTTNLLVNKTNVTNSAQFDVVMYRYGQMNNMSVALFSSRFKNSSHIHFLRNNYKFFGYVSDDNSTYSMFNIYPVFHRQLNETIKIFSNFLITNNFTKPYKFFDIYYKLNETYFSKNVSIIGLKVQLHYNDTLPKKQFYMNTIFEGIMLLPFGKIHLKARELDYISSQREARIFAVFVSLFILFHFYGWRSMIHNFNNHAKVAQLSLLSFLLHNGFDYSYPLIFINYGPAIEDFAPLYGFVFLAMILFYSMCEMPHLGLLLRHKCFQTPGEEIQLAKVALYFGFYFINLLIFVISSNMIFKFPKIIIPLIYSFFLPQIVFNVYNPQKYKKDLTFIILITISRLFPIFYFGMYPNNVEGTYSQKYTFACTAYLLAQTLILILQNRFGGDFFLPIEIRPHYFDYEAIKPPPGSECAICLTQIEEIEATMTTPCQHYFHRDCLRRWLQEQLVCPICRANLPQLVSSEPEMEPLV